jgi:response regulator of citrate/malate metabolism
MAAKVEYVIKPLACDRFDKRMVEKHLRKSQIEKRDLDAHLAGLPDLAPHAQEFRVGLSEGED